MTPDLKHETMVAADNQDGGLARLGRRRLVLRLASLSAIATALTGSPPEASGAEPPACATFDTDPQDPGSQGRARPRAGPTDTDPQDPPGEGRGQPRTGSGPTDSDPKDPPQRGRGEYRDADQRDMALAPPRQRR